MKRILIVDDDSTMLLVCRRIVARLAPGAEVTEAASGEYAIEILRSHDFDLVLSDYRMGATTGVDVLEFAATQRPRAVRVLMSGFGDPALIESARSRARIHAFVEKPVGARELRSELETKVFARYLLGDAPPNATQTGSP